MPTPAGLTLTLSRQEAARHFRQNKLIEQVAAEMGRAKSTITQYLAEYILSEKPESIAQWVPEDVYKQVAAAVSAFWSLLNERFDPHSAKALMARVAAAAAFGGLAGGVGAERVAALMSQGALFTCSGCRPEPPSWVQRSSVAECHRGADHRRSRRSGGADGPRSGACHFFETSPL